MLSEKVPTLAHKVCMPADLIIFHVSPRSVWTSSFRAVSTVLYSGWPRQHKVRAKSAGYDNVMKSCGHGMQQCIYEDLTTFCPVSTLMQGTPKVVSRKSV